MNTPAYFTARSIWIQVHGLHQIDTKCAVLQLIGRDVTLHPARAVGPIEIQHLPGCVKVGAVNVALDWQKATGKARIGPIAMQLDAGRMRQRQE
jgi:hypothetical protein